MEVAKKLLDEIRSGKISSVDQLEFQKIKLASGAPLIKNSQIAQLLSPADGDYKRINEMLKIKNVRTASGVANIAVMWKHIDHSNSCPAQCIYCPQGKDESGYIAPKSYTGVEPTTLRAIRNDYDPYRQVANRIKQLNLIGHSTDKCELIIMGGTFMATPLEFQDQFVKACFDAFNGTESGSLDEAHLTNETATNRCIGLTIETRADFCTQKQIDQMLKLGCTRVEIGVQSVDDDLLKITKRGHGTHINIEAIQRLKENGIKVCIHWMPGLTGLYGKIDEEKEVDMFRILFDNPSYRPDELKIYPTLVISGTELHALWKEGKYNPLTKEQAIRLLIEFKKLVPEFVRIKRVMRDISEHKPEAGARTTNLRQLAKIEMEKSGVECRCIRCREIGHVNSAGEPSLMRKEYDASGGKEIFLSYQNNALFGFLRLRIDSSAAKIRELHVYGNVVPISIRNENWQHRGLGKKLMEQAEDIAKEHGKNKISVTSGIGARGYYRKLGYILEAPYMTKTLSYSKPSE